MRLFTSLVFMFSLLITLTSQAQLVNTDWKTLNDGLAVLDTSTGKEWLKLDQTAGLSYNAFLRREIAGFAGWRVATHTELSTIVNEIYPGKNLVGRFIVSPVERKKWTDVFGWSSGGFSLGWYERNTGKMDAVGYHTNSYIYSPNYITPAHNNYRETGSPVASIFLISDGGTTLSSINNPNININNPNAPVNTFNVTAPMGISLLSVFYLLLNYRKAKKII